MTTPAAGIGKPVRLNIKELNTHHKNPRRGDVDAIAGSLAANGQFRPIVVNKGTHTGRPYEVLAGNHTLMAFRQMAEQHPEDEQWQTIDTYVVDVDDERATRIVLADNRTADLGTYDNDELLDLLDTLDGDYAGTGYDEDYVGALLGEYTPDDWEGDTEDDTADLTPPKEPTSRPGDVWHLGPHRLLVGDSTDSEAVTAFMDGDQADCVWTDPPYGVNYVGKTKDALEIQNDGAEGLPALIRDMLHTVIDVSRPGAPVYIAHPAGALAAVFHEQVPAAGIDVRQNLVWVKDTFALGHSDYHYRHEPIIYGFTPNGEGRLGRGGDYWHGDNAQDSVFEVDKPGRSSDHPTMKPPELIGMMLNNSCKRGG